MLSTFLFSIMLGWYGGFAETQAPLSSGEKPAICITLIEPEETPKASVPENEFEAQALSGKRRELAAKKEWNLIGEEPEVIEEPEAINEPEVIKEPEAPKAPAPYVEPAPIEYYTCGNTISLPTGTYNIDTNNIGLKVVWTNMALLGTTDARFTSATEKAVKQFQKNSGLPETGIVDLTTWLALGYSEDDWKNLGTYVTPLKVSAGASHEECVTKMIETAEEYMNAGTEYRIGCSGKPGTYADCSGLIFQCLYSIGVNPASNIVEHALAIKEYTSRDLCADERLGLPVSYENMDVGDLIFYTRDGKKVCHVAIYVGDGMMIDSDTDGVKLREIRSKSEIFKIVRVCP